MSTRQAAPETLAQGQNLADDEARLLKAWSHEFLHVAMMSAFVSLGCNCMRREQTARLLPQIAGNIPDDPAVHRALRNGLLTMPTRYAAAQYVVQDAYAQVAAAKELFDDVDARSEAGRFLTTSTLDELADAWQRAAQELNHALGLMDQSGLLQPHGDKITTLPTQGPDRVGQLLTVAISGETLASSGMQVSDKGEMPNWAERRRWERQESNMSCLVTVPGGRHAATIRNVSLGGALVDPMPQLARMTPITIETATGRLLSAKVMWSRDNAIGVKFDQQLQYNDPLIVAAG